MTNRTVERQVEANIGMIKFHTAELISQILRYNADNSHASGQAEPMKYDYLKGRKDALSPDGAKKSITIFDKTKLIALLGFLGEMGFLKGKAHGDYLKLNEEPDRS